MTGFFDQLTQQGADDEAEKDRDTEVADSGGLAEPEASDITRTPGRLREAAQELLKYGLLEEERKPNLYRLVTTHVADIEAILEPLDLALGLDGVRGLVFVVVRQGEVTEQDDWSHPLVRRQRLNLEQTLLVAILRQYFVAHEQEGGTGIGGALVAIDDLIPQVQVYLGDTGSDAKERNRILALLDQLKGHGLVSAPDQHERVTVRPIIAHLANPENLQALLEWLREQTRDRPEEDQEGEIMEDDQ
ncbi:DUF4194 domain-containing protein [Alloalcanivorax xenomutans]|uniref:DUF4194 domain-containing protein n=1 Tax=Alloalcanivorax xenomutans TaxID=1094342 RepID=UPI0024E20D60|nr:DUF4194 domain-containing protein [Alloalcanivorax xenomutans]